MKKKTILLITILFGLMLAGIVVIQAGWIQRIAQLNQKAFEDAVYKSLAAVVKQVEEKENFGFIKHQVETDEQLKKTKKFLKEHAVQAKRHKMKIKDVSNNVSINISSDNGKETKTVVRIEKDGKGQKYIYNSVYVGAASIDSIPGGAVIVTPPKPPALPDMETVYGLEDKKENVEIILEKMLSISDPDSVSIDPKELKELLATQLKQNNLPQKFTFALFSKDPSKSYTSDLTATIDNNKIGMAWKSYKVNLYPNDLFGREVTLEFWLPSEAGARFDMWGPLSLSFLFTLVILILFIYSIRMLIRHKKMLEMKNDFINHMSHEFKTPLAGISLGADILMSKPGQMDAEQVTKVAGTIKKQSQRLSKEVNDVLQNALLEENINKPHVLFNLVDTIKSQVELFQPIIENAHAKIITDLSSEKILLLGDESQWQKVFSNLIDNALKFSKEDPEIIISAKTAGSKILLSVSDNGIGIASKDLPRIFEKFFRSDYYKQSNIKGFGLGLSFVKNIVEAHGGSIKAESELNKGTRIIIEVNAES